MRRVWLVVAVVGCCALLTAAQAPCDTGYTFFPDLEGLEEAGNTKATSNPLTPRCVGRGKGRG